MHILNITCDHLFNNSITLISMYLIFGPQQDEILACDAVSNKMHPMVLNTEIQISKPKDHPKQQKVYLNNTTEKKKLSNPI